MSWFKKNCNKHCHFKIIVPLYLSLGWIYLLDTNITDFCVQLWDVILMQLMSTWQICFLKWTSCISCFTLNAILIRQFHSKPRIYDSIYLPLFAKVDHIIKILNSQPYKKHIICLKHKIVKNMSIWYGCLHFTAREYRGITPERKKW